MNANSLHSNYLRSPSNLTRKGREEEPHASLYCMAMSIATDLSMDTDCLLDDWSPTDNTSEDLSIHPPPLLERQRSSSPRSVSGFWPMGFFTKDSKVVDTTNTSPNINGNANSDDLTDCLLALPLPLKSSLSIDLMNKMHEYFNNDLVRDILPKTTLTFYADREHKLDDFSLDDIGDEMLDAAEKMDSYFGKRNLLEDFPPQSSNGKEEDPLNFLARVEYNKAPKEKHPSTDVSKSSIRKKTTAKNKKAKKVPAKKITKVKVVSGGKTLVSIKAKLDAAKLNASKEISTKKSIPKRKTERKTLVSINAKLDAAMMNARKDTTTKKSIPKRNTGGKTLASIKAKLDAAKTNAAKDTNTTKSIPKRKTMPLVKKKITTNKKTTTKNLQKTFNKAPMQPNKVDPSQLPRGNWEDSYNILKAFYDENGHSNVVRSYHDRFLAGWVKRQRNNMRLGKLTSEQIRLLQDVDFAWNMVEKRWCDKFLLLREFARKYERSNITANENRILAEWTQRQRREYRLGDSKMSAFRIEMLESLPNWTWIAQEKSKRRKAKQSTPEPSKSKRSKRGKK